MNDPFAALNLFEDPDSSSISVAFAAALQDGMPVADARLAMDMLRDPARREAVALLSPSMTPAAKRQRTRASGVDEVPAIDTILRFLRVVIEQIDGQLAAAAEVPTPTFDIDASLPPLPDYLRP